MSVEDHTHPFSTTRCEIAWASHWDWRRPLVFLTQCSLTVSTNYMLVGRAQEVNQSYYITYEWFQNKMVLKEGTALAYSHDMSIAAFADEEGGEEHCITINRDMTHFRNADRHRLQEGVPLILSKKHLFVFTVLFLHIWLYSPHHLQKNGGVPWWHLLHYSSNVGLGEWDEEVSNYIGVIWDQ